MYSWKSRAVFDRHITKTDHETAKVKVLARSTTATHIPLYLFTAYRQPAYCRLIENLQTTTAMVVGASYGERGSSCS